MTFLVVSSAPLIKNERHFSAYSPYVDELNVWDKSSKLQFSFCCPVWNQDKGLLNKSIKFKINNIFKLREFNIKNKLNLIKTLNNSIKNIFTIYKAMKQADHIHLRCPGNMGLLGCLVQILFPKTSKTAKYAGNWDPKSKQPWSYKLQQWILSNTFLTRNMQVLVYGQWSNQTKNIKSFFTATYQDKEKEPLYIRNYTKPWHFCFVGSLSQGKHPELALEFVHQLRKKGIDAIMHYYGNGELKTRLEKDIRQLKAQDWAFIYGNQPKEKVKEALKYSHFLILPSQSEGWPKVVAEAMFWGCIPIVTPISCVPWMLDDGKRGVLMDAQNVDKTVEKLISFKANPKDLEHLSTQAAQWSRQYTLDKFEQELSKLL